MKINPKLKGIIKGIEFCLDTLDKLNINSSDVDICKISLLRLLQHWQQVTSIKQLTANELNLISEINDMDELDIILKDMNKDYFTLIENEKINKEENISNNNSKFICYEENWNIKIKLS